jgi:MFS family permease
MRQYFYNIHRLLKIKSELGEVYLNRLIQSLALSMVGVFVPVYLINLGYSLNQVILFLIAMYSSLMILSPISAIINSRIGIKHTIGLSFPFLITYLLLLFSIKTFNLPIILIAGVYGIYLALYWIPLNSDFAKNSDKLHRGTEISYLLALPNFVGIIAPLVGGWVINNYGFNELIIIVFGLLFLSMVPLFMTSDYKSKLGYEWKRMVNRENLVFLKEFVAKGMLFASSLIWPIFVYYMVKDYLLIGFAVTLTALSATIFIMVTGKLSDRVSKLSLLKIGGITNGIIWISVFIIYTFFGELTPLQVFIISFLKGFTLVLIDIPLFAAACNQANKQSVTEFMVLREVSLDFGRILVFSAMILMATLTLKFQAVFILTALASFYFVFVKY